MIERIIEIGPLSLECGAHLEHVSQCVTIYGDLDARRDDVVFVAHGLTGSSRPGEWWSGIVGPAKAIDTSARCVIGINVLGSCYGSTGPTSLGPDGLPYGQRFPRISVRDIAAALAAALRAIGVERVHLAIGGSLGGMQVLQLALDHPGLVEHAVMVGAHDHHSAFGIALNALQRDALALDPKDGLRLARKIAMLSYKSDGLFRVRHDRKADRGGRPIFDVEGYLDHQADLFEQRMDAATYATLTHAMDSFDVRDHAAQPDSTRFTFVGITSDWLFLPQDVEAAALRFQRRGFNAAYRAFASDHGHDAFLAESNALAAAIADAIATAEPTLPV